VPGNREWRDLPAPGDASWTDVFRKLTDATSAWSVAGAAVLTLVLTCVILLSMRPQFLMSKIKDGETPRLSAIKLLACAVACAAVVGGIGGYLLYSQRHVA
jgi:hypothetical protein